MACVALKEPLQPPSRLKIEIRVQRHRNLLPHHEAAAATTSSPITPLFRFSGPDLVLLDHHRPRKPGHTTASAFGAIGWLRWLSPGLRAKAQIISMAISPATASFRAPIQGWRESVQFQTNKIFYQRDSPAPKSTTGVWHRSSGSSCALPFRDAARIWGTRGHGATPSDLAENPGLPHTYIVLRTLHGSNIPCEFADDAMTRTAPSTWLGMTSRRRLEQPSETMERSREGRVM
ncbi:hypothetical protein EJ04DRAFT_524259 [Polyplosphaeria fusca]|uniref:Uncharacterized protein n=1 Tax=Polyplosphaeria fusca TaxID=682080 RepID=A0A9P4V1Z2_9PLEO|nr:hypothetical protein EJ04DRAFT_524259 [Polyplosphaeria fusca]